MFVEYLQIVAAVDAEFERNRELHGSRIQCRSGCTDCCHHRFSITGLEAAYIVQGLERMKTEARQQLRARARDYLDAAVDPSRRLPCPALDNGICSIYEFRPLMCHRFGMPIYNPDKPGRIFACELNFKNGEEIVDSQLIQIQTGIHQSWKALRSKQKDGEPSTIAQAILSAP